MQKAFSDKGGKMSRSVGAFQSVKLQLVRTTFAQKTRNSPLLLTELSEF